MKYTAQVGRTRWEMETEVPDLNHFRITRSSHQEAPKDFYIPKSLFLQFAKDWALEKIKKVLLSK